MSIDTSAGVSNTCGYSFTGVDPTLGGIAGMGGGYEPYTGMVGGGNKTIKRGRKQRSKGGGKFGRMRRKMTKRIKQITKGKLRSMKKKITKNSNKRYKKKRMVQRKDREDIIKSVESGKSISKDNIKNLTPSMIRFLSSIETNSKGSVVKFSDFKPGKTTKKKRTPKKRGAGGAKR